MALRCLASAVLTGTLGSSWMMKVEWRKGARRGEGWIQLLFPLNREKKACTALLPITLKMANLMQPLCGIHLPSRSFHPLFFLNATPPSSLSSMSFISILINWTHLGLLLDAASFLVDLPEWVKLTNWTGLSRMFVAGIRLGGSEAIISARRQLFSRSMEHSENKLILSVSRFKTFSLSMEFVLDAALSQSCPWKYTRFSYSIGVKTLRHCEFQ